MDVLAYQQMSETKAGKTAMWVIVVAIVVLIFAYLWNKSAEKNCQVQTQLGILTGNMGSVDKVVSTLAERSYQTGLTLSGTVSGLVAQRDYIASEFGHAFGSINRLDNAVFVPRSYGGGCGRGGRPEYEQIARFKQESSPEVVYRSACGNEFN